MDDKQIYNTTISGDIYGLVIGDDNTVIINLADGSKRRITSDVAFFHVTAGDNASFVGRQKEMETLRDLVVGGDFQSGTLTKVYEDPLQVVLLRVHESL